MTDSSHPSFVRRALSPSPEGRKAAGDLLWFAIVYGALYFVALRISRTGPIAPLWPPAGALFAGLLLFRHIPRWVLLAVAFTVGRIASPSTFPPSWLTLGYIAASYVECLIAAEIVNRWRGANVRFTQLRDLPALVIASAIGVTVNSILSGFLAGAAGREFWSDFMPTWIGGFLGMLVVTPLIVAWAQSADDAGRQGTRFGFHAEVVALAAVVSVQTMLVFHGAKIFGTIDLRPYSLILPILWAALRFGVRGTMTVVAVITVLAFVVVIDTQSSVLGGATQDERLLSLQWYVGFITVTGLTLAAALAERREAERVQARLAESLVASERRLQQSQKMEAVGQLAGGIAHDFNNILSAMSLQVHELGASRSLDTDAREIVRDLDDAVQRASTFTRRLLLFGRRQTKEERRVDLDDISTGLSRLLARLMPGAITLSIKPSLAPLWIMADPSMVEQVVMNLVINARDAMAGGGQLTVSTRAIELDAGTATSIIMGQVDVRPGPYAVLQVTDTGHGIKPENLPRLFEPFFTTKEAGAGTGLGLSTVFSVAQEHNGYVRVVETSPAGTTFEFGVPLADGTEALAMQFVRPSEPAAAPRLPSARVLLVEDRDDVRRIMQRIIERAGMEVTCAEDASSGVARWEEAGPFDLLITDLVMPGSMGGMQLSQELRRRAPDLKVVYTSAYDPDFESYDPPLVEGVNYIPKPASASQILKVVEFQLEETGRSAD